MIMQGVALREPFSVAIPAKRRDLHIIFCRAARISVSRAPHRVEREILTPFRLKAG
jgi:hypothetical protein